MMEIAENEYITVAALDDQHEFLVGLAEARVKADNSKINLITTRSESELYHMVKSNIVQAVTVDYKIPNAVGKSKNGVEVIDEVNRINSNVRCAILSHYVNNDQLIEDSNSRSLELIHKSNNHKNNIRNIELTLRRLNPLIDPMTDKLDEQRELISKFKTPLLMELKQIPDQKYKIRVYKNGEVSVSELIEHIEGETDVGKRYINLWVKNQNMFVQLKNPEFRKQYDLKKRNGWNFFKKY